MNLFRFLIVAFVLASPMLLALPQALENEVSGEAENKTVGKYEALPTGEAGGETETGDEPEAPPTGEAGSETETGGEPKDFSDSGNDGSIKQSLTKGAYFTKASQVDKKPAPCKPIYPGEKQIIEVYETFNVDEDYDKVVTTTYTDAVKNIIRSNVVMNDDEENKYENTYYPEYVLYGGNGKKCDKSEHDKPYKLSKNIFEGATYYGHKKVLDKDVYGFQRVDIKDQKDIVYWFIEEGGKMSKLHSREDLKCGNIDIYDLEKKISASEDDFKLPTDCEKLANNPEIKASKAVG